MTLAELTRASVEGIAKSGPTDPIEYYRRPLVGWLYRERINRGLRLLPPRRFGRGLEVGYGAGALSLVMAERVAELHGIDLDADPAVAHASLARAGRSADFRRGSVYALPFADESFDLVFSFSVFEHLPDYPRALAEVARVLRPGGHFLLGMPAVNRAMGLGFRALGFKGIDEHHVTTPRQVASALGGHGLPVVRTRHFDLPLGRPLGWRLYYNWLSVKRSD